AWSTFWRTKVRRPTRDPVQAHRAAAAWFYALLKDLHHGRGGGVVGVDRRKAPVFLKRGAERIVAVLRRRLERLLHGRAGPQRVDEVIRVIGAAFVEDDKECRLLRREDVARQDLRNERTEIRVARRD